MTQQLTPAVLPNRKLHAPSTFPSTDEGWRIRGALDPGGHLQHRVVLAPDFVVLVEANGRTQGRTTLNGQPVDASGGQVLSVAPAVMLSYRNVMLKGGVDIPIWERVNDPNESADVTILAALELHW